MLHLFLLLSAIAHAKSGLPAKKAALLNELNESCVKSSFVDGKSAAEVCACLKANYEIRFTEEKLIALQKIHAGTLPKEEHEAHDDVFDFDMLASEKCIEESNWRYVPEKAAKAEKLEKPESKNKKVKTKPKSPEPAKP